MKARLNCYIYYWGVKGKVFCKGNYRLSCIGVLIIIYILIANLHETRHIYRCSEEKTETVFLLLCNHLQLIKQLQNDKKKKEARVKFKLVLGFLISK